MKRYVAIVGLNGGRSDIEIVLVLKEAQSFVIKFRKELEFSDEDDTTVAKRRMPAKDPNTLRTPHLYERYRKKNCR